MTPWSPNLPHNPAYKQLCVTLDQFIDRHGIDTVLGILMFACFTRGKQVQVEDSKLAKIWYRSGKKIGSTLDAIYKMR
jgi:hypothetical protein